MGDVLRMIRCLVAGGVVALYAAALVGMWAALVVIGATGWATAQYDHNYRRVDRG